MAVTLGVGHKLSMALVFLDQNGNPMLTPPTLDGVPTWTDNNSTVETLTPASSGLTCDGKPIAPGSDVVSVSVSVGGTAFSATLDVTVTSEPQVLSAVRIDPTVT